MAWNDYWNALGARQRIGLSVGAALIVALVVALGFWWLRDPYVPLVQGLDVERLNEIALELTRQKVSFQVAGSGDALNVRYSELGQARAALASGSDATPPSVGLELFKETDFSSTDFAQRINYQRALQGEITRTIEGMSGVRSARVHVTLPESGLFKREAAKATAAVSVTLQPGKTLTSAQVLGIQRLVTASVPEIKIDDVVVLDESGAILTRVAGTAQGELSSANLDLKRQADQYLEGKLRQLLQDLLPEGVASLSVDTTLDERQLRVTTEEPLPARSGKDATHLTGVLVKERQSQRGRAAGLLQTDTYSDDADSIDREVEYKVGNRVEQTMSAPGAIKRISVAVAVQGAPAALSVDALEQLVANAVGMDKARGDSVAVLLLPASSGTLVERAKPFVSVPRADDLTSQVTPVDHASRNLSLGLLLMLVLFLAVLLWWVWSRGRATDEVDSEAVAAKVRQWLKEGSPHDRA